MEVCVRAQVAEGEPAVEGFEREQAIFVPAHVEFEEQNLNVGGGCEASEVAGFWYICVESRGPTDGSEKNQDWM